MGVHFPLTETPSDILDDASNEALVMNIESEEPETPIQPLEVARMMLLPVPLSVIFSCWISPCFIRLLQFRLLSSIGFSMMLLFLLLSLLMVLDI